MVRQGWSCEGRGEGRTERAVGGNTCAVFHSEGTSRKSGTPPTPFLPPPFPSFPLQAEAPHLTRPFQFHPAPFSMFFSFLFAVVLARFCVVSSLFSSLCLSSTLSVYIFPSIYPLSICLSFLLSMTLTLSLFRFLSLPSVSILSIYRSKSIPDCLSVSIFLREDNII